MATAIDATHSPRTNFLEELLDLSARLFGEYRHRFQPFYEGTVQTIKGLPCETADEIRNAFDHISRAINAAAQADINSATSGDVDALKEAALTNLEQARRHLVRGQFFCAVHQVVWQIERILIDDILSEAAARGALTAIQVRAGILEAEFRSTGYPEEVPSSIRAIVQRDIAIHERYVSRVVGLVTSFHLLYEDAYDVAKGLR